MGEALPLLYNEASVVTGLVYNYVPFVILAIYSSISRLNPEIAEASEDLGAPSYKTFLRVILPLTLPGIAAGCGVRLRAVHRQLHHAGPARWWAAYRWWAT